MVVLLHRAQSDRLQQIHHRVVADVDADQLARTLEVERHRRVVLVNDAGNRIERLCRTDHRAVVDVDVALRDLRVAVLLQEVRRPL